MDDRRLGLNKDHHVANQHLEREKKRLKEEISVKKKNELNNSILEVAQLKKKLDDVKKELGHKNTQLEEKNKKLADYEAKQKEDLDAVEQKCYDFCFEEQTTAVVMIQGRLYQEGSNRGLDVALIPSTSEPKVRVTVPVDFNYEEESKHVKGGNGSGDSLAITGGDVEDIADHDPLSAQIRVPSSLLLFSLFSFGKH